VEGVGARLWQAEAVQLLHAAPPLGPIPVSAMTVSHFRMLPEVMRSDSAGSRNSGSSLPDLSRLMLPARLLAEWFLWMKFLNGILGDLSEGVDCVWTRLLKLDWKETIWEWILS
jgi:hypothetical protein